MYDSLYDLFYRKFRYVVPAIFGVIVVVAIYRHFSPPARESEISSETPADRNGVPTGPWQNATTSDDIRSEEEAPEN
jgi:hypothetical protein